MSTRSLLIAALLCAAPAARAAEAGFTVTFLRGEATARPEGGSPAPVAEGAALHERDLVETEEGALLEIALATGSILRLGPRSRLELRSASADAGSFTARLTLGNLWAKVQKLLGGQRFQVETQNGVAGVRGTEFRVTATASGLGLVRVYEGAVEVKGTDGKWTHLVKPGSEIRYSKGATLGPRPFDVKGERSSFMRWVRRAGPEKHERRERPRAREHEKKEPHHK